MERGILLQFDSHKLLSPEAKDMLNASLINLLQFYNIDGIINISYLDETDELVKILTNTSSVCSSVSIQQLFDECLIEINKFISTRMHNRVKMISLTSSISNFWLFHVYEAIVKMDKKYSMFESDMRRTGLEHCFQFGEMLQKNAEFRKIALNLYNSSKQSTVVVETIVALTTGIYNIFTQKVSDNNLI